MSVSTQTFRGKVDQSIAGDDFFKDIQTVTTPGAEQTILNETVGVGKQINLLQLFVTCRMDGFYRVYIDTTVIASGRTGAATPNCYFNWTPYRKAIAGEQIMIKFTSRSDKPVSDLEAYLHAREVAV
jgi:hypothetical protein